MRITGDKAHAARLMRARKVGGEVGRALYAGAQMIQVEAQISITTGAVSGKNHVPSLPGEPPNQDTGILGGHIEAVQTGPLRAEVSSNAPYALPLEVGTSRMAARPYMAPATDRRRDEVTALVRRAVERKIRQ